MSPINNILEAIAVQIEPFTAKYIGKYNAKYIGKYKVYWEI